jgi:hypothetical protein
LIAPHVQDADSLTGTKLLPPGDIHSVLPAGDVLAGVLRAGVHEEESGNCCYLDCFMHGHECVHYAASEQGRECSSYVSYQIAGDEGLADFG